MKWSLRRTSPNHAPAPVTSPYREAAVEEVEPPPTSRPPPPQPQRSPLGRLKRKFTATSGLDSADKFVLGMLFASTPLALVSVTMLLCIGALVLVPLLRWLDRMMLQGFAVRVHSAGLEIVRAQSVETMLFADLRAITVAPLVLYAVDGRVWRLDAGRFEEPEALVDAIVQGVPRGRVIGLPEPTNSSSW